MVVAEPVPVGFAGPGEEELHSRLRGAMEEASAVLGLAPAPPPALEDFHSAQRAVETALRAIVDELRAHGATPAPTGRPAARRGRT